jgi:hypothetical protein
MSGADAVSNAGDFARFHADPLCCFRYIHVYMVPKKYISKYQINLKINSRCISGCNMSVDKMSCALHSFSLFF